MVKKRILFVMNDRVPMKYAEGLESLVEDLVKRDYVIRTRGYDGPENMICKKFFMENPQKLDCDSLEIITTDNVAKKYIDLNLNVWVLDFNGEDYIARFSKSWVKSDRSVSDVLPYHIEQNKLEKYLIYGPALLSKVDMMVTHMTSPRGVAQHIAKRCERLGIKVVNFCKDTPNLERIRKEMLV